RLLDLGSASKRALRLRPVPVAVLFAGALRRVGARLVRAEAGLVARLAALFASAADPVGARRLPPALLLLPRGVLQGVLGRPTVVRRWRAAQGLLGRALLPPRAAKYPPL